MISFSLKELEQEYGASVRWRSFELRPAGSPPIPAAYRARIEQGRVVFAQRARDDYGVEIQQGPFGIDSRPSLILEKYAEAQGKGAAYHHAVETAYWLHAQDISQVEVLARLAAEAGLAAPDLGAILADARYTSEVDADIALAQAYRIGGVPAVVFENRYLVSGAQPREVFREVAERVLAEKAAHEG